MNNLVKPSIKSFFDPATYTISHVVYEGSGSPCVVIDSVLDYDAAMGRIKTTSADAIVAFVRENNLKVEWILETHAHADHLSAAHYVKRMVGGKTAIGENIKIVQGVFGKLFNLGSDFHTDGCQFDHLFKSDELFSFGNLQGKAISVPGHTPADMAYQIGDAVFVGDTLFMPDVGTARCDFPGGNAHMLYRSIKTLMALPSETRLYMCHDYPPPTRDPCWETTVADERTRNIHVHDGVTEELFVQMRESRDKTLGMPALILPSIQVNIRAGELPSAENNGVMYLKIPLNSL